MDGGLFPWMQGLSMDECMHLWALSCVPWSKIHDWEACSADGRSASIDAATNASLVSSTKKRPYQSKKRRKGQVN